MRPTGWTLSYTIAIYLIEHIMLSAITNLSPASWMNILEIYHKYLASNTILHGNTSARPSCFSCLLVETFCPVNILFHQHCLHKRLNSPNGTFRIMQIHENYQLKLSKWTVTYFLRLLPKWGSQKAYVLCISSFSNVLAFF